MVSERGEGIQRFPYTPEMTAWVKLCERHGGEEMALRIVGGEVEIWCEKCRIEGLQRELDGAHIFGIRYEGEGK